MSGQGGPIPRSEKPTSPFHYVDLVSDHPAGGDDAWAVPPSLRDVKDLLAEFGIDMCHETVRRNSSGPMFAAD